MGHCIQAIIGGRPVLDRIVEAHGKTTHAVALEEELSLLPISDELYDALPDGTLPTSVHSEDNFLFFSSGKLWQLLLHASDLGRLAYVETDYFGGAGDQMALVAHEGQIIFGPRSGENAINDALRLLGIVASHGRDEFDTIGLGARRSTGEWLAD